MCRVLHPCVFLPSAGCETKSARILLTPICTVPASAVAARLQSQTILEMSMSQDTSNASLSAASPPPLQASRRLLLLDLELHQLRFLSPSSSAFLILELRQLNPVVSTTFPASSSGLLPEILPVLRPKYGPVRSGFSGGTPHDASTLDSPTCHISHLLRPLS
ncbi:hypothetical protein JOL62DRAFT_392805 [Phyllosticta paracitricarpa]|uniref:Uncharacterized protein n=1 Tax=Phyllosticta paracitricarpa TaxID=2016321 RepID=A0ABR1MSK1_9PEZI